MNRGIVVGACVAWAAGVAVMAGYALLQPTAAMIGAVTISVAAGLVVGRAL